MEHYFKKSHHFRLSQAILIFTCVLILNISTTNVFAALLDGMFDGFEESLSQRLAKDGEQLTIGNFYTPERADSHGPIGMMGEHTHNIGELMFTYRYMQMEMDGIRDGTSSLSPLDVRNRGFTVVPTYMKMQMHMFGAMYGVNETLTLTAMLPYLRNTMDHLAGATLGAAKFQTRSEGAGDLKVGSLWRLYAFEAPSIGAHRFHLNFGLSLPTGDITQKGTTPLGVIRLPYPMQLGSGTVDILPGLTYGGAKGNTSWGLQALGTYRIARNKAGYSKGDEYEVGAYGAYAWTNWLSNSIRFKWRHWFDYDGQDTRITRPAAQQLVFTADPDLRGGQQLDIMGGVNVLLPEFLGLEHRLGVEGGVPIYQNLDGPQLETDWAVTVGWQVIH
ncbi:MAG: hypothetical protein NPIRA04_26310 [Nitrospirales bacterium]|nr:MAG: hypothetical protein NPIRA04_26310 [Nitrospirales bacterium]